MSKNSYAVLEVPLIHDGQTNSIRLRSDLLHGDLLSSLQELFQGFQGEPIDATEFVGVFEDALIERIDVDYYEALGEDDQLHYLIGAILAHFGPDAPDVEPEAVTASSPWADFSTDGMAPN